MFSNYSIKNLVYEAGINMYTGIQGFRDTLYTGIPLSIYFHANLTTSLKNFLRRKIVVVLGKTKCPFL